MLLVELIEREEGGRPIAARGGAGDHAATAPAAWRKGGAVSDPATPSPPHARLVEGPFAPIRDPKVGGVLRPSVRVDRDLARILIMDPRIEAFRPSTDVLPESLSGSVAYVAATFDDKLLHLVVVDDEALASGRLRDAFQELRRNCRMAGGRMRLWTARRIRRAYPAAVDRMIRATGPSDVPSVGSID